MPRAKTRLTEGRPSATAYRVAMQRAAHQILDDPRVLDDPIALRIVGAGAERAIRSDAWRYQSGAGRTLRAFLIARSRHAEETLAAAVAAGVRQYVVLGAGLDTFAYRNPHPPGSLQVFEVDHPTTQAWKRKLLASADIPVPGSLAFVPIDFEAQALPERLSACGFRAERPACFSWLGVTMYLSRDAFLGTLAYVGARPPGSSITFDYLVPPASLPWVKRVGFYLMSRRVRAAGEPWRTWFDPDALAGELRRAGFTRLEDLDGDALDARYFDGRSDRLRGRSVGRVVTAAR